MQPTSRRRTAARLSSSPISSAPADREPRFWRRRALPTLRRCPMSCRRCCPSAFPLGGQLADLITYLQWSWPQDGSRPITGYDVSVEFNESYVHALYLAFGYGAVSPPSATSSCCSRCTCAASIATTCTRCCCRPPSRCRRFRNKARGGGCLEPAISINDCRRHAAVAAGDRQRRPACRQAAPRGWHGRDRSLQQWSTIQFEGLDQLPRPYRIDTSMPRPVPWRNQGNYRCDCQ